MRRPFVPPMIARVDQPRLPLRQAVLEAPEFNIDAAEIGHPSGYGDRPSSGPAGLLSIGTRPGPGGPGDGGDGPGGFVTGQRPKPARVTRGPRVIYQEEPEYSEEARKARFQGAVVLQVEIGTDGRTSKIRVVRSVGLGLDERAIEAVSHWRFDPARNGEGPVAATALVEVSFHLL